MPKTCLVTGGAGFIGSHVADRLLNNGYEVVVLDDLSGGIRGNLSPDVGFVHGSVTDQSLVSKLFLDYQFHAVFHLAAYAAENLSHFVRSFNYTNNVVGTMHLINASVMTRSVERFVFTSSAAVYGAAPSGVSEDVQPTPLDPYGIAKLSCELDLKCAARMFGLNYTIFRPHNVYGERQNLQDPYRNVIGIFINQLLQGKPLTIFGDGSQTRPFTYIDDVSLPIADAILLPEAINRTFNVGSGQAHTVAAVAEMLSSLMSLRPVVTYVEGRHEAHDVLPNHDAFSRVFGLRSNTALRDGLRRMVDWATQAPHQQQASLPILEVTRELPPLWRRLVRQGFINSAS